MIMVLLLLPVVVLDEEIESIMVVVEDVQVVVL
jgi:hypothetical protein